MAQKRSISARKTKASGAKRSRSVFRDVLEVIIPAFLIFIVVKTFFFEARFVPTPSMVPTLELHDRFLENKLIYRFRQPRRGEIVVFHPPEAAFAGTNRGDDLVKRVVGLSGETVIIRTGRVYIKEKGTREEFLLAEPYVPLDEMDYLSFRPFKVPEGHLFVLGDNRRQSRDSRYWLYVPIKSVDGKAFWRFWPLNRISLLH